MILIHVIDPWFSVSWCTQVYTNLSYLYLNVSVIRNFAKSFLVLASFPTHCLDQAWSLKRSQWLKPLTFHLVSPDSWAWWTTWNWVDWYASVMVAMGGFVRKWWLRLTLCGLARPTYIYIYIKMFWKLIDQSSALQIVISRLNMDKAKSLVIWIQKLGSFYRIRFSAFKVSFFQGQFSICVSHPLN